MAFNIFVALILLAGFSFVRCNDAERGIRSMMNIIRGSGRQTISSVN